MASGRPPVVVPVYFDYASSLCYLAWRIGERLVEAGDVVLWWRPVSIAAQHPAWRPGTSLAAEVRARVARVSIETGIPVRIPERWLDSQAALAGALYAAAQQRGAAYHEAVFGAVYERGADIGDPGLLGAIAETCGLSVGGFQAFIASPAAAGELDGIRVEAQQRGVVGYPTFLLGAFPLVGIQPYATMRQLLARHIARSRGHAADGLG